MTEVSVVVDPTNDVAVVAASSSGSVVAGPSSVVAHTHPATDINDSTAAGRALLTAESAAAQRTTIGLDTTVNQTITASGSAVSRSVDSKLKDVVSVKDFGAVGDWNGTSGTDNLAAFSAAINYASAQSYKPAIHVPAGAYKFSGTLTLPVGITLVGEEIPKAYGPITLNVSVLVFDFIGVGINTYVTPGDGSGGSSYIQVKNLGIDGNSKCTVGYDGGFVQSLESVNIANCTLAGVRLNGQTTTLTNCALNGNYDGVLIESGTTFTLTTCTMRQNTRNGVRATCNASLFYQCIFESNTEEGVYLTGTLRNVDFQSCYWEQNDAAAGSSGYNCRIAAIAFSPQINFTGCTFGSISVTNIAYLDNCEVRFTGCSQTGQPNNTNITTTATAKATVNNSFNGYSVPTGVISADVVSIYADAGLSLGTNGTISSIPTGTTFGTGDFTVSFAVQLLNTSSAIRGVCSGSAGAMGITLTGSTDNIRSVNVTPSTIGPAVSIPINSVTGQIGVITVVRASGVIKGFFNGLQVYSGAYTSNFTNPISVIGFDNIASYLNGILYKFCAYSAALTDEEVFNLFKNGTNPVGVQTTNLVLNINTARRPSTTAYETVNAANLTFAGAVAWLNPTS